MSTAKIESAIDMLRGGFQSDGADLRIVDIADDAVTVELVGTAETCWDCIVQPDQLRDMVEAVVKQQAGAGTTVRLQDPREA